MPRVWSSVAGIPSADTGAGREERKQWDAIAPILRGRDCPRTSVVHRDRPSTIAPGPYRSSATISALKPEEFCIHPA